MRYDPPQPNLSAVPALRIAQLTDPHLLLPPGNQLMGLDTLDRFRRCLAAAVAARPAALFLTGDFCAQEPDPAVYAWLRPRLDETGLPYYLLAGNHDDRRALRQSFDLPGAGNEPIHYTTELAGHHFVCLDSSPGELDGDQLPWLDAQLRAHPAAFVFVHHPPAPLGVRFMDEHHPIRDGGALLRALSEHGPRHVFCGHYHAGRDVHRPDGITVHCCPPTSFHISPDPADFHLDPLAPAWRLLELTDNGELRVVNR